jgi:hypothetical protein
VAASAGAVENLSEVEARAVSEVADLLAAAESVGDDDGERPSALDCGEEIEIGDGFGEFEFVFLEAKGAGHAAAGGVDELDLSASLAEQREF